MPVGYKLEPHLAGIITFHFLCNQLEPSMVKSNQENVTLSGFGVFRVQQAELALVAMNSVLHALV